MMISPRGIAADDSRSCSPFPKHVARPYFALRGLAEGLG